jgi:uncharacterized lipoprotein YajG
MKLKIGNVLAIVALVFVTGCATSRSVVSVGNPTAYNNTNPSDGIAVKIVATDARSFELKPATPDIPSLKDGAIGNTAVTSRAIGRKRNGYGKALGDVLLPDGQTVAMITQNALANGFRQAGYRVLNAGDPGFDQAVQVDAQVRQYWSWVSIGFWAITLHCRVEAEMTAPLDGLRTGLHVDALAEKQAAAAFEEDWQNIANEGLSVFTTNVAQKLPRHTAAR